MNLTRIILYKESDDIGDGILLNAWIPFNEKYFVKDSTLKELDTAQRKYEICKHQSLSPEEELILKLHKKEFLKQQALEG